MTENESESETETITAGEVPGHEPGEVVPDSEIGSSEESELHEDEAESSERAGDSPNEGSEPSGETSEPTSGDEPQSDEGDPTLTAPRPKVRIRGTVMKEIQAAIDPEHARDLLQDIAETYQEIVELEEDKKSSATAFNAEIKAKKKKCSAIADEVSTGYQTLPVRCYEEMDITNGIVEIRACYDDHLLETRPITPEERQLQLALDEDRHPDDREGMNDADVEAIEAMQAREEDEFGFGAEEDFFDSFLLRVRFPRGVRRITIAPYFKESIEKILSTTDRERPEYWPAIFPVRFYGIPYDVVDDQDAPFRLWNAEGEEIASAPSEPASTADVAPDGTIAADGGTMPPLDETIAGESETATLSEEEKGELLEKAAAGEWAKDPDPQAETPPSEAPAAGGESAPAPKRKRGRPRKGA